MVYTFAIINLTYIWLVNWKEKAVLQLPVVLHKHVQWKDFNPLFTVGWAPAPTVHINKIYMDFSATQVFRLELKSIESALLLEF